MIYQGPVLMEDGGGGPKVAEVKSLAFVKK